MDNSTQLLICLAASVAANCVPCFEHYYGKSLAAGVLETDIKDAVALGGQVRQGSAIAMTNSVLEIMGGQEQDKQGHPCRCD